MGYRETKEMAKGFTQKTDKAVEELKQPGLFAAIGAETCLTFECIKDPSNADVQTGDIVRVIDMNNKIEVFKNLVGVGFVVAADSFRSSIILSEANGMAVDATVIEVSELNPTFIIKVHKV